MSPGAATAWWALLLAVGARCGTQGTDDTAPSTQDEARVGLRHFSGEATVSGAYAGTEAFHFTGEQGLGDDVCRIRYAVSDVAERADCADCTWAFDLETGDASIEAEIGKGCSDLGVTAAEFEGLQYSYGYAPVSGPYEHVLMYQVGSYGWYPVSFASWKAPSFSYDWEMGLYYY